MSKNYLQKKASSLQNKWNQLSKDEKTFIILNPWYKDEIEEDSNKAKDWAVNWFGKGGLHNGPGDAFRHCFWNALLARDIGPEKALEFTTAHEQKPGQPANEKQMDLHNNKKGVEIGRNNPNADDYVLAVGVWNAYHKGELMIIDPGSGKLKPSP